MTLDCLCALPCRSSGQCRPTCQSSNGVHLPFFNYTKVRSEHPLALFRLDNHTRCALVLTKLNQGAQPHNDDFIQTLNSFHWTEPKVMTQLNSHRDGTADRAKTDQLPIQKVSRIEVSQSFMLLMPKRQRRKIT